MLGTAIIALHSINMVRFAQAPQGSVCLAYHFIVFQKIDNWSKVVFFKNRTSNNEQEAEIAVTLTKLYPAPGPITRDNIFAFFAATIENPVSPTCTVTITFK